MNTPAVPVLYIAGSGRSGSTLLANVLGSIDGIFNAGELRFAWERGLADGALCACRKQVIQCPVWTRVFDQSYGGFDVVDAAETQRALASRTRMRKLPQLLVDRRTRHDVPESLRATLLSLYEAILSSNGVRLIIDSSKLPTYGLLLSQLPEIDLKILHLVRDPRAVAWSWMRHQPTGTVVGYEETMDHFSPTKSASLWSIWNVTTRHFWQSDPERYMAVRYEDFVANPGSVSKKILEFVGVTEEEPPFVSPHTVQLSPNHSIAGNPNRMRFGETRIDADQEWRSAMPTADRLKVTALTAPILPSFGYGVRP